VKSLEKKIQLLSKDILRLNLLLDKTKKEDSRIELTENSDSDDSLDIKLVTNIPQEFK
jgi:hypothetical protein